LILKVSSQTQKIISIRKIIADIRKNRIKLSISSSMVLPPEISDAIDRLMRADLKSWQADWFGWLAWSTKVVILGLLFDAPEAAHDFFSWIKGQLNRRRAKRMLRDMAEIFPIPDDAFKIELKSSETPHWFKVTTFIGIILVTVGVGGELISQAFAEDASNAIEVFDSALLTAAQAKAGNAANSAEAAGGAAKQVIKDEAKISSDLDKEGTRERTAEQDLEVEKKKRLDLAASLLPRRICEQNGPARAVSQFPKRKVLFEYVNEREARRLAQEIAWVFRFAGYQNIARRRVNEDLIDDGVYIIHGWLPLQLSADLDTKDRQKLTDEFNARTSTESKVANALRDALMACEIEASSEKDTFGDMDPSNDGISEDTLIIRIGSKPNRALEATIRELGPLHLSIPPGSDVAIGNRVMIPDEIITPKK
jgi:hypothetical protein